MNNNNISADWNNVVSNNVPANPMLMSNSNIPMNNNNPYVNNIKTKKKFKTIKKSTDPMKIVFIVIGVLIALICAFLLIFPLFNKKKGYREGTIQANNFYSLKYNANEWIKDSNNNYLINSKNSRFKVDNATQTKAIEAYDFAKKDSRSELLYRLKSEYKRTYSNIAIPDSDFKLLKSGVYLATFEYSTSNGSRTIKGKKYVVIAPDYNLMLTLTSVLGNKETYKELDNEMLKMLKTINILAKKVTKTTNKPNTNTNTTKPNEKSTEQKNYQVVGSSNYGYIKLPNNWKRFIDKNNTQTNNMQYISNDLRYAVTMTALSKNANITPLDYLKSIEEKYSKTNVVQYNKMTRERVGIKKYESYRLDMYLEDDKVWMSIWVFRAEDDRIHYVSIEGSNNNSTVFNYINTYVLNKNDMK